MTNTEKNRRHNLRRRWRPILLALHGNRCAYCDCPLTPETATTDHFWPTFYGGSDGPENMVPACTTCNKQKDKLPPLFFRAHRAELAAAVAEEGKMFLALQRARTA